MRQRLIIVICVVLVFSTTLTAQDTFRKWLEHVQDVYYYNFLDNLNEEARDSLVGDPAPIARLLGYALSLQLKYVQRGSEEHTMWLELEEKTKAHLQELVDSAAVENQLRVQDVLRLEKQVMQQFGAACAGWYDEQMAVLTGISQQNVPNFFGSVQSGSGEDLAEGRPQRSEEEQSVEENEIMPEEEHPGLPSDAVLGKWRLKLPPGNGRPRHGATVVVRRADPADPAKYEGYYFELSERMQRRGYKPGQLAWKLTFKYERNGTLFYDWALHSRHSTGPEHERDYFVNGTMQLKIGATELTRYESRGTTYWER